MKKATLYELNREEIATQMARIFTLCINFITC